MKFMIEGEDVDVLLETKENLEEGIKGFALNYGSYNNLGELIQKMRARNENTPANPSTGNDQAPGFKGLAGALAYEALAVIETEALEAATTYDTKRNVIVSLEGKIIHYKFTPNGADPKKGNLELTVITAVSSRKYLPNGKVSPVAKTVGYKWQIEVKNDTNDAVVVHDNCHLVLNRCNDDDQPFPGTMELSEAMIERVNSLKFKIKLWAKGEDIVIHNVWRKNNFRWTAANNTNWGKRLKKPGDLPVNPGEKFPWARLYASDAESCIDIMFASVDPPEDLLGLGAPPYYCLGRCANPAIVNSR